MAVWAISATSAVSPAVCRVAGVSRVWKYADASHSSLPTPTI